jgi:hypothetical protein
MLAATVPLDPFGKKIVKRANPSRGGGAKPTDLQEVAGLPLFLVISRPFLDRACKRRLRIAVKRCRYAVEVGQK